MPSNLLLYVYCSQLEQCPEIPRGKLAYVINISSSFQPTTFLSSSLEHTKYNSYFYSRAELDAYSSLSILLTLLLASQQNMRVAKLVVKYYLQRYTLYCVMLNICISSLSLSPFGLFIYTTKARNIDSPTSPRSTRSDIWLDRWMVGWMDMFVGSFGWLNSQANNITHCERHERLYGPK